MLLARTSEMNLFGLLDEEGCHSTSAIYAWWFGLKLVFNTFWNAKRKADVEKGADHKS
jgi:hypothetical protein